MNTNVISLVSIGAHPTSGRARRAEQDARAVELGLQLAGDNLQVVHAGDVAEPALRAYLGMGLDELRVLEQPAGADALPVLTDYLRDVGAQVVLTGSQAETGEGSGMLPFLLAENLGWPLVVGLAQVESINDGVAQVLQALPRGQRRRLKVRLPFLATVDNAAPKPRQSAYGPAQRGVLQAEEVQVLEDELFTATGQAPAQAPQGDQGEERCRPHESRHGQGQRRRGAGAQGRQCRSRGRGDPQAAGRGRRGALIPRLRHSRSPHCLSLLV